MRPEDREGVAVPALDQRVDRSRIDEAMES
jgi:hypothetical protein